jgi:hypothetical protein
MPAASLIAPSALSAAPREQFIHHFVLSMEFNDQLNKKSKPPNLENVGWKVKVGNCPPTWEALAGVDAVIHSAGLAQAMSGIPIKRGGFRILARRDAKGVRLFTRNGYNFADRSPMIVAAVENLPVRSCFIRSDCRRS